MLTNREWHLVACLWGQFHMKWRKYLASIWVWKLLTKMRAAPSRSQCVNVSYLKKKSLKHLCVFGLSKYISLLLSIILLLVFFLASSHSPTANHIPPIVFSSFFSFFFHISFFFFFLFLFFSFLFFFFFCLLILLLVLIHNVVYLHANCVRSTFKLH